MAFILSMIFGIFVLFSTEIQADRVEGFEHIFRSDIYSSHNDGLRTFVNETLERYPTLKDYLKDPDREDRPKAAFIQSILDGCGRTSAGKRAFHKRMLTSFRKLLLESKPQERQAGDTSKRVYWSHPKIPKEQKLANKSSKLKETAGKEWECFLDDLATWIYIGPSLHRSIDAFFYGLTGLVPMKKGTVNVEELPQILQTTFLTLRKDSRFGGLETSHHSSAEDLNLQGDIPSRLFTVPFRDRRVLFIRTPNVLGEVKKSHEGIFKVNEEFIRFVNVYGEQGKKHLYINLQTNVFSSKNVNNLKRSKVLEDLDRHGQSAGLAVVTLDKNSLFYLQCPSTCLEPKIDANLFKKEFMRRLFARGQGFYWAKVLNLRLWRQEMADTLEEVHLSYFGGRETLTVREREDFIELVYLRIIDLLLEHLTPESVNITCHVSIDRAPSTYALYYFYKSYDPTQNRLSSDVVERIKLMLFAPGLYTQNRPLMAPRVERMVKVIQRLLGLCSASEEAPQPTFRRRANVEEGD